MLTIACPITYIDPHTLLRTDIWARTIAFSSNLLSTTSVSVLLGDLVTGIATATFGGHLTCQLESWRRCPDEEWTYGSQSRIPDGSERDLDHWTWSSLPALGGSGFVVNMRNGYVVGARLAPLRWIHAISMPTVRSVPPTLPSSTTPLLTLTFLRLQTTRPGIHRTRTMLRLVQPPNRPLSRNLPGGITG